MALHLITGRAGVEHVTADNAGHLNAQILGANNFIFNVGEKFRYNLNSNNELRIYDGMGLLNGRQFELPSGTYEDLAIENGSQGMYRNDLVVARYSLDTNTGLENIEFVIITGEPNETEAVDPAYNEGDILEGDTLVDYPLYRIKLNGLNVTAVEDLFIVIDSISEQIGNDDISAIGDGTIKGGLNSLNQKLVEPIKSETVTSSATNIGATSGQNFTFTVPTIEGYTPYLGFYESNNQTNVLSTTKPIGFVNESNQFYITLYNPSGSARNGIIATASVIYIKTALLIH